MDEYSESGQRKRSKTDRMVVLKKMKRRSDIKLDDNIDDRSLGEDGDSQAVRMSSSNLAGRRQSSEVSETSVEADSEAPGDHSSEQRG